MAADKAAPGLLGSGEKLHAGSVDTHKRKL